MNFPLQLLTWRVRTVVFTSILICAGIYIFNIAISWLLASYQPQIYAQQRLSKLLDKLPPFGENIQEREKRLNSTEWEGARPSDVGSVIEWANSINRHHEVLNEALYGRVKQSTVDAVLVIQVHDRVEYLNYLVDSLSRVVGVEQLLLVISHDVISEPINQLVRNIKFARIIQILYPYSLQLFEGYGKRWDGKELHAKIDAQIRQHWWWKTNYVFDGIITRYALFESYVVIMEDDEILTPDFLHVLKLMVRSKPLLCPQCLMLKLGVNAGFLEEAARRDYYSRMDEICVIPSSALHRGMAITLDVWEEYRTNCSKYEFCTMQNSDGYDWILYFTRMRCIPHATHEMWIQSARVINIGTCGTHIAVEDCSSMAVQISEFINRPDSDMVFFPVELHKAEISSKPYYPEWKDGWSDSREHQLCLLNTYPLNSSCAADRVEIARSLFTI